MSVNFSELFPELLEQARALNTALSGVAMILLFTALLIVAWRGVLQGESANAIHLLGTITTLAVAIHFFPGWVDQLTALAHGLIQELDADPSQSHQAFARLLTGAAEDEHEVGFWDVLWADEGGMGKAMLYVVVLIVGKGSWLVVWNAYLVQHVVAIFGIALSPAFLALFALPATRGVAIKFVLSLIAVVLWPVGWAVTDIMTDALLQLAAEDRIYVLTGKDSILAGTQTLSFILLLSVWMLASTIAAPFVISRSIETGSQVGTALLASVASATAQGLSFGLGAGATAAYAGASRGATTAAAMGGGTAGLVSGAMGSANALVPAAIGTMAVAAHSNPSEVNRQAAEIAAKNQ